MRPAVVLWQVEELEQARVKMLAWWEQPEGESAPAWEHHAGLGARGVPEGRGEGISGGGVGQAGVTGVHAGNREG